MLYGCTNLYGGNGTAYDENHTNAEYARIDIDGTSGYFTKEGATPFDPDVPYAVYSEDGKTLYFYYAKESKKPENVMDFPAGKWDSPAWAINPDITTVVITESFENYYPTSCYDWFNYLGNLTSIEGLEYLKTSEVTIMRSMFAGCSSLQSLDLSKFEVGNVEYADYMFAGCSSLRSLDLSKFDVSKVKYADYMFSGCSTLRTIFVAPDWKLAENVTSSYMFSRCTNLYGGNGTAYDEYHIDAEYAKIDINDTPGYFTKEGATPYEPYSGFTITEGIATFPNSETEIVIRQEIKVKGVVFDRTFKPEEDGTTYPIATMALPFDVPAGEYEGGTFYEFTGIEKGDDGKWTAKMTKVAGNLEANKPYLFKPSAEKLTFNFSGEVTLRPTSEVISDNENSIDGWTFNAVYKRQTWGENHGKNDYIFTSQAGLATDGKTQIKVGDFVRIGSNCWLNPMRCYLSYNSISKAMPELPSSIDVILIDITTPVSELTPATSAARVWSYSKTIFIEAQPGTAYQIIGINGAQLLQGITTSTRDEVSLPGNVDGIVIVKIGGKSFKIMY
ncbi:MAG: BspA family leucine-rich repeat surface protein [Bacteroidales bacterium]|nr:BspA family leucine-rich repeat surface protein [Bacteroidales bacterium]